MFQVWSFLYPNYRHWVDIYITDASVSMLSIKLLAHLCPRYGDSYTRITVIGSTCISQIRQARGWEENYWNTTMSQLWRFLYPNYSHWPDIYIADASVSVLSIHLFKHTYVPSMEIPIPELPSLGRQIYHRCVSLYAEHTIIGTHLCPRYGNLHSGITVTGSTYMSQIRHTLCWAYYYFNTPMSQVWKPVYPNNRH